MLAATVLAVFLVLSMGGGSFGELISDHLEKPMKTTVQDDGRRKAALQELALLRKSIKGFNKGVAKDIKSLNKLVDDYESTPEAFDALFASAFDRRKQELGAIWEGRAAMMQHIQPNEWTSMVDSATAQMTVNSK